MKECRKAQQQQQQKLAIRLKYDEKNTKKKNLIINYVSLRHKPFYVYQSMTAIK
jgi:hypothetical protein